MKRIAWILALVVVGIWMGLNIAQDRPLFSNPFADSELGERAKNKTSEVIERSTDVIKRQLDQ